MGLTTTSSELGSNVSDTDSLLDLCRLSFAAFAMLA